MILMATCAMTSSYASGSVNEHVLTRQKIKIQKNLRRFKRIKESETENGKKYIAIETRYLALVQQNLDYAKGISQPAHRSSYTRERLELEQELCAVKKRLRFFESTDEDSDQELNRNEISDSGLDSDYNDIWKTGTMKNGKGIRILISELETFKKTEQSKTEMGMLFVRICEREVEIKKELKEASYSSLTSPQIRKIRYDLEEMQDQKSRVRKLY